MEDEDRTTLSGLLIGAAIEVHRELGPGLLESTYEACLCRELELRGIPYERQKVMPIGYKGMSVDAGYRIDVMVENELVVELKSVKHLEDIHRAQLLTYLKLSRKRVGLLINFNVPVLRDGIVRMLHD